MSLYLIISFVYNISWGVYFSYYIFKIISSFQKEVNWHSNVGPCWLYFWSIHKLGWYKPFGHILVGNFHLNIPRLIKSLLAILENSKHLQHLSSSNLESPDQILERNHIIKMLILYYPWHPLGSKSTRVKYYKITLWHSLMN